jgi:hypothetical protein
VTVVSIEALRASTASPVPRERPGSRGARRYSRFLKGPVQLAWLERAMALEGKALAVGIFLWYLAGLERAKCVRLNLSRFDLQGVSRFAASRGLRALERAGLVECVRGRGRVPAVTIVEVPELPDPEAEP